MVCLGWLMDLSSMSICLGLSYTLRLGKWVKCLSMVWETGVQYQVESYQRPKKWYLMLPYLTLSIIWYRSRVKWSNPGKGVAPSPTPRCCSYWKGSLQVTLDEGQPTFYLWKLCDKVYLPASLLTWICIEKSSFQLFLCKLSWGKKIPTNTLDSFTGLLSLLRSEIHYNPSKKKKRQRVS